MSVLIPDLQIYRAVASKMFDASFRKTVDINHFSCCSSFKNPLTEERIWALVKCWLNLNETSYNAKYKEREQNYLAKFLKEKFIESPNTFQFLKWLQCVRYNIERSTIETIRPLTELENESLLFLERLILEAQMAIISSLPQYQEAKWSEVA